MKKVDGAAASHHDRRADPAATRPTHRRGERSTGSGGLRREELVTAGELVRADAIAAAHARAIEELLGSIEQWLPDLAIQTRRRPRRRPYRAT